MKYSVASGGHGIESEGDDEGGELALGDNDTDGVVLGIALTVGKVYPVSVSFAHSGYRKGRRDGVSSYLGYS